MKPAAYRISAESGMTLVEVLAALFVFSIAVMAMLHAGGENARAHVAMEERALAGVVAENRMVETVLRVPAPEFGSSQGEIVLAGRLWRWSQTVAKTPDPAIARVEVSVSLEDRKQVIASLTGFRGVDG